MKIPISTSPKITKQWFGWGVSTHMAPLADPCHVMLFHASPWVQRCTIFVNIPGIQAKALSLGALQGMSHI